VEPWPLSVQLLGLKVPLPLVVKLTVPVGGRIFGPCSMSRTCAVQVVGPPTETALGEQVTVVVVLRLVTLRAKVPLLHECVESPA